MQAALFDEFHGGDGYCWREISIVQAGPVAARRGEKNSEKQAQQRVKFLCGRAPAKTAQRANETRKPPQRVREIG